MSLLTIINLLFSIIAIHGLDGHPEESWTAENGKLWLRDFLPKVIPQARIMTYGYDAYTHGRKELNDESVYNIARNMLARLASERQRTDVSHDRPVNTWLLIPKKTENRPIIFIAHSLGGLVLKEVSYNFTYALKEYRLASPGLD